MKQFVIINKAINLNNFQIMQYVYDVIHLFVNKQLAQDKPMILGNNEHYVYNVVLSHTQQEWLKEKTIELMYVNDEKEMMKYMDLSCELGMNIEYRLHHNELNESYMAICAIGPCKEENIEYLKKEFNKYFE